MRNYLHPIWCPKCAKVGNCYQNSIVPKCFTEKQAEQTEPQTDMAENIVRSFGFKAESYRQAKAKKEP